MKGFCRCQFLLILKVTSHCHLEVKDKGNALQGLLWVPLNYLEIIQELGFQSLFKHLRQQTNTTCKKIFKNLLCNTLYFCNILCEDCRKFTIL